MSTCGYYDRGSREGRGAEQCYNIIVCQCIVDYNNIMLLFGYRLLFRNCGCVRLCGAKTPATCYALVALDLYLICYDYTSQKS